MKALLTAFILAAVLCACAQPMERVVPPEPMTAKPVDMHTSRNSLDWAGIYEGILPGADRAGVKTRLTLNRDGTYERVTLPVGRQEAARTVRGSFAWQSSGNAIRLDEPGGGQQFAVGEGRLLLLHPERGACGDAGARRGADARPANSGNGRPRADARALSLEPRVRHRRPKQGHRGPVSPQGSPRRVRIFRRQARHTGALQPDDGVLPDQCRASSSR